MLNMNQNNYALGKPTCFLLSFSILFLMFHPVFSQTLSLSGNRDLVTPCSDVTYTITGQPTGNAVNNFQYTWENPAGGTKTISATSGCAACSSLTIRWDNSENTFTKATPRVVVTWDNVKRNSQGVITEVTSSESRTLTPLPVTVKFIGSITPLYANGVATGGTLTVDCGQRDVIFSVNAPRTDPPTTSITYTWVLPSGWTLLAQGGTGGGQTNQITARTDVLGSGTVSVRAVRETVH